jgi:hypothetical protein
MLIQVTTPLLFKLIPNVMNLGVLLQWFPSESSTPNKWFPSENGTPNEVLPPSLFVFVCARDLFCGNECILRIFLVHIEAYCIPCKIFLRLDMLSHPRTQYHIYLFD